MPPNLRPSVITRITSHERQHSKENVRSLGIHWKRNVCTAIVRHGCGYWLCADRDFALTTTLTKWNKHNRCHHHQGHHRATILQGHWHCPGHHRHCLSPEASGEEFSNHNFKLKEASKGPMQKKRRTYSHSVKQTGTIINEQVYVEQGNRTPKLNSHQQEHDLVKNN